MTELTREQKYFIENDIEVDKRLYEIAEKEIKRMIKNNNSDIDALLTYLGKVMLKYNIKEEVLKLSTEEKEKLKSRLLEQIDDTYKEQTKKEIKETEEFLTFTAQKKYELNNYLLGLGISIPMFYKLTNKKIQELIYKRLKRKTFADRITKNKTVVATNLKEEIINFLNGKTSVNSIKDKIELIKKQNNYATSRLTETETARIIQNVNKYWQLENKIEKVLYSSVLDNKVCDSCRKFEGKIYNIKDIPVELPQHTKCRCSYITIVAKEYKPKSLKPLYAIIGAMILYEELRKE